MNFLAGADVVSAVACVAIVACAIWIRFLFIRQAAPLRVDHHYWLLAAAGFRRGDGLRARSDGRFLLEPREQAYPPIFGWCLSHLPKRVLSGTGAVWLCQLADAAALGIGVALGVWLGLGWPGLLVLLAATLFAPTLVAYNTQLNPRSLGNLFLMAKMASEVAAVGMAGPWSWLFWAIAVAAAAAVWLTHKMTTQLMLVLWLPWAVALGSGAPALVVLAGLLLAAVIAGPSAMLFQLAAHLDIVRFWSRNWPYLGLNAVAHSPIYGQPTAERHGAFHKPGLAGCLSHFRLILGYAPAMLLMPLMLMLPGLPSAPAWLVVWTVGTLVWAMATSMVPSLKGLGAGSLYIYFGVIPSALWLGLAADHGHLLAIAATAATAAISSASLVLGWRQRQSRSVKVEDGYENLVARLRAIPNARLAVIPLTSADPIAAQTSHSVLWGAHGYGFDQLEPIFPRITRPLGETFARYGIHRLVWNANWWPEAEARLSQEMTLDGVERYGAWRTAAIRDLPRAPPPKVCKLLRHRAGVEAPDATETTLGRAIDDAGRGEAERSLGGAHAKRRATTVVVDGRDPWRFLRLYGQLRHLGPDIVDCRAAGITGLIVANLAGIPHRVVAAPKSEIERRFVSSGLAKVAPPYASPTSSSDEDLCDFFGSWFADDHTATSQDCDDAK
ncbi:MAG: hypothetical protein ACKVP7_16350 [Hyphomicrobiaceae bacterium]